MTPDTPEPEQPERQGAPSAEGAVDPRIPRVLISVDDLHNPGDWDVIVVEDPTVDDETARNIARARAGKKVTLPSLDERDVMRAFDTDRDAEGVEGISVDAFGPPEGSPAPRRLARTNLPPADDDAFAGMPEPEPEPAAPAAVEPVEPVPAWTPRDLAPMDAPVSHHRPTESELAAGLGDYPAEPDEPADVGDLPATPTVEPATADVDPTTEEPDTDPAVTDVVPDGVGPVGEEDAVIEDTGGPGAAEDIAVEPEGHPVAELLDDPGDAFYDIGDAAVPAAELAAIVGEDHDADSDSDSVGPASVDGPDAPTVGEERELLDDPDDPFFALGARADAAMAAASTAEAAEHPDGSVAEGAALITRPPAAPTVVPSTERLSTSLWGSPGAEASGPTAQAAPGAPAPASPFAAPAPAAEPGQETFEDELEFDSSFPLGPDDVVLAGEALPIAIDTLDYASVFGPVEGTLEAPELAPPAPRPPRRPKPLYYQHDPVEDLDRDEEGEEDDDELWPVAPVRSGGRRRRRRELVVLGVAAGAIAAIGIGTQVFGGAKGGNVRAGSTSTSTTIGVRVTAPDSSNSTLFAPTTVNPAAPFTTDTTGATGATGTQRSTATTAGRGPATTVARSITPTTAAPPTTRPAPTTTVPPAPTTTAAPVTTTTVDAGTTGGL